MFPSSPNVTHLDKHGEYDPDKLVFKRPNSILFAAFLEHVVIELINSAKSSTQQLLNAVSYIKNWGGGLSKIRTVYPKWDSLIRDACQATPIGHPIWDQLATKNKIKVTANNKIQILEQLLVKWEENGKQYKTFGPYANKHEQVDYQEACEKIYLTNDAIKGACPTQILNEDIYEYKLEPCFIENNSAIPDYKHGLEEEETMEEEKMEEQKTKEEKMEQDKSKQKQQISKRRKRTKRNRKKNKSSTINSTPNNNNNKVNHKFQGFSNKASGLISTHQHISNSHHHQPSTPNNKYNVNHNSQGFQNNASGLRGSHQHITNSHHHQPSTPNNKYNVNHNSQDFRNNASGLRGSHQHITNSHLHQPSTLNNTNNVNYNSQDFSHNASELMGSHQHITHSHHHQPSTTFKETPLTAQILQSSNSVEQKNSIGQRLFPRVQKLEPRLAGKITGLLLKMGDTQLIKLLSDEKALINEINEAVAFLKYKSSNCNQGIPSLSTNVQQYCVKDQKSKPKIWSHNTTKQLIPNLRQSHLQTSTVAVSKHQSSKPKILSHNTKQLKPNLPPQHKQTLSTSNDIDKASLHQQSADQLYQISQS